MGEVLKFRANLPQISFLRRNTRGTISTFAVGLLDAVGDKVGHRNALLTKQRTVAQGLFDGHGFRNRNQHERRFIGGIQKLPNPPQAIRQVGQEYFYGILANSRSCDL